MKVILVENLKSLGTIGQVVEVKPGFARNYLIPQGIAMEVTADSYKRIEELKRKEQKANEKKKKDAADIREKIEKLSVTITTEAKDDDEIYGSITEAQICKALSAEGVDVTKDQLTLSEPIKKIGAYSVEVLVHPEVQASLRVWVVRK